MREQDDAPKVCAQPGCCALAVAGQRRCSVHLQLWTRQSVDVPVHCYACGALIRIGAKWIVRAEGAFHLRAVCLSTAPAQCAIARW